MVKEKFDRGELTPELVENWHGAKQEEPKDRGFRYLIASLLYLQNGDHQKALATCKKANTEVGDLWLFRYLAASVLGFLGEYDESFDNLARQWPRIFTVSFKKLGLLPKLDPLSA